MFPMVTSKYLLHTSTPEHILQRFYSPCFSTGGLGEAGPGGGDASQQVLHPVEEAERKGDSAGDLWERKGKYLLLPTPSHWRYSGEF